MGHLLLRSLPGNWTVDLAVYNDDDNKKRIAIYNVALSLESIVCFFLVLILQGLRV